MYGKDRKEIYMTEKYTTTTIDKYFLKNLFKKTEPFETELDKDICNFTTREIENMYKTLDYRSYDSIIIANNALSQYTGWCMNQGFLFDSQNHFLEFDRTRLSGLINKVVMDMKMVDRETVLKWCNELPNACDAFIVLGLFEGIRGRHYKEFLELTESDIDAAGETIYIASRGRKVKVSKNLCWFGVDSANEEEYKSMSESMLHNVNFIPSDKVIKEMPNWKGAVSDNILSKRISNKVLRAFSFLGVVEWMDISALVGSGIIHMIKTESEKLGITNMEYINTHLSEVEEQFNKKITKSIFLHKYGDYLD